MSIPKFKPVTLAVAVAAVTAQAKVDAWHPVKSFQATGRTTTGAGTATIKIQGSLDGINWTDITTLSLPALATVDSTVGFTSTDAWRYIRSNVTAITGTGATVDVFFHQCGSAQ